MSKDHETSLPTADLLASARSGNQQAWEALFARHADRLQLFVRLRLGPALACQVEPADVLQETYLRALQALPQFESRGSGSFLNWLCRIADNCLHDLADHHGAAKRRPPGVAERLSRIVDHARLSATGPPTAAARLEAQGRLTQALQRLPEDERQALVLRFFEGRSLDELAPLLGRSATSVRRLLGRAMALLGQALESRP